MVKMEINGDKDRMSEMNVKYCNVYIYNIYIIIYNHFSLYLSLSLVLSPLRSPAHA